MKKTSLLIAVILSSQLFYGCSMIEKEKDKLLLNTTSAKTESRKSTEEASKSTEEASTSSNWDSLSDEAEITPDNSVGLQSSNKSNSEPAKVETKVDLAITKTQMQEYLNMTKTSIVKKFGTNYKKEGNAITYSNGLSFYGLTSNESKPTSIRFKDNVSVMGIKNGMTFDKVQAVLGKTNIIDTYINVKTNKAYKLQYTFEKSLLKVVSTHKDGSSSYVEAVRQ